MRKVTEEVFCDLCGSAIQRTAGLGQTVKYGKFFMRVHSESRSAMGDGAGGTETTQAEDLCGKCSDSITEHLQGLKVVE